ncbi:hypothetical protein AAHA92_33949 [Salvia divinorum]|uniref:Uncharacterized protein n=1 Tax=Salvia divinorum TaxID=28513 RepID=A0ABD1FKI7_SALDI
MIAGKNKIRSQFLPLVPYLRPFNGVAARPSPLPSRTSPWPPASPSSRLLPSRHLRELLHGTATVAAIVPEVNTASLSTDYGQDFVGKGYEQVYRHSPSRLLPM